MKKLALAAAAAMCAVSAQAGTCFLLAKDNTCSFATDSTGGQAIYENPQNLNNIGSGIIKPFLGTQANGTESGVSTDEVSVNILPLNDKRDNANTFTNTFSLSQLGFVTRSGVNYFQFFLDTNEPSGPNDKLISIDTLRIWDAKTLAAVILNNQNVTQLSDVDGLFSALIYTLGIGNDLIMDGTLFSGSGQGYDLSLLIPTSVFAGVDPNSRIIFGTGMGSAGGAASTADGFEEWGYLAGNGPPPPPPPPPVPEPASLALVGLALVGAGVATRRNRKEKPSNE